MALNYVMKALNKLVLWGYKILKNIGAAVLLCIFLSITVGIVTRRFLNNPITWSEELCCFMMVHICFISAATTTVQKKHIVADFFITKAPPRFQAAMRYVSMVLQLVFFIVLFFSVIQLLPTLVWTSPVLHIPRQAYYASALICAVFMFITVLTQILNDIFPQYDMLSSLRAADEKAAKEQEAKEALEIERQMDEFMESAGHGAVKEDPDE